MGAGASTQRWTKDEVLAVIGVACDDAAFDEVVGCIEDIVVGTQFQAILCHQA